MTRRSSIALLLLAAVTGALLLVFGNNSAVKLVSTQVVTIPSRGRAVEFVLKNNSCRLLLLPPAMVRRILDAENCDALSPN